MGGECKAFDKSLAPKYAVRGRTRYDQDWIDPIVETGVAGCNWPRPLKRPPELDAPRRKVVTPAPVVKRTLRQRIRERIIGPRARPETAPGTIEPVVVPLQPAPPPVALDVAPSRTETKTPDDDLLTMPAGDTTKTITNQKRRVCWPFGC